MTLELQSFVGYLLGLETITFGQLRKFSDSWHLVSPTATPVSNHPEILQISSFSPVLSFPYPNSLINFDFYCCGHFLYVVGNLQALLMETWPQHSTWFAKKQIPVLVWRFFCWTRRCFISYDHRSLIHKLETGLRYKLKNNLIVHERITKKYSHWYPSSISIM